MGESDGARGKQSYVELDEPGAAPTAGAYDASSEKTAAVELSELEPVDAPAWEQGVGKTEHLDLADLEEAEGGSWADAPQKTEAVELEDLEVLEKLDPKQANAPPALPSVGERSHAPRAPLPIRRKAPAKAAKPRSAPPPPPRPPTRAESIEEAPKPMIGSEGWTAEDRVSMVDFSAVLSAPPPPRSGEPTEKIAVGAPALTPPAPAQPEPASGSGAGRWLLIGLLVLGVGAGAYFLGRQGSGPEPVVTADDPEPVDEVSNAPEPPAVEEPEPLDEGPDEVLDEAPDAPAPEPAVRPASTMRRPSAMSAVADRPPAMEPEPAAELEPTPAPQEPAVAAMAPEPELPPHPTRQEVQIALDSVRPQVAACLDGQHGTVRVRVTVRGSGRVTTAVVQDSLYAQPPVGSCIARAVRGAPFPPFSQESFVVLYPFQL